MRKLIVFMHVTLDGFVAGPKGEMDFFRVDEELFEYAGQQTDLADTALYGRNTYEMMDAYWPKAGQEPGASKHDIQHSEWYNRVKKVVLSTTLQTSNENTTIVRTDVANTIRQLKESAGKNILVFGSPTAVHSLLYFQLIDEFWLFVNPVILGSGIPMFKDISARLNLKLAAQVVFKNDVVALNYHTSQ